MDPIRPCNLSLHSGINGSNTHNIPHTSSQSLPVILQCLTMPTPRSIELNYPRRRRANHLRIEVLLGEKFNWSIVLIDSIDNGKKKKSEYHLYTCKLLTLRFLGFQYINSNSTAGLNLRVIT
jgi:hypothetical protein